MRSSSFMVGRFTVGLGACVLLLGVVGPAAGQSQPRNAPIYGEMPEARPERMSESKVARKGDPVAQKNKAQPDVAAPISKGPPSGASESPAAPSSGASGGGDSLAPATAPSGLSHDAPDTAPSVGVVGGGKSGGSPSPASTPEPSTLLLMGAGLAGLYRLRRRR